MWAVLWKYQLLFEIICRILVDCSIVRLYMERRNICMCLLKWMCVYKVCWRVFLVLESAGIRIVSQHVDVLFYRTWRVCANVGQLSVFSILDTLFVLWYMLQVNRALRLWTISNLDIEATVWGSQNVPVKKILHMFT